MKEPPPRWDELGRPVKSGTNPRFSEEAIRSGKAVAARDRLRSEMCMSFQGKKKCLGRSLGPRAEIAGSDLPEALTDNGASGLVRTLEQLEARGLDRVELPVQPWSSDYWAYFKGVIASRYADGAFPGASGAGSWDQNHAYFLAAPPDWIGRNGSAWEVDLLSPAEKYDLLTGDRSFSLTHAMWATGEEAKDESGAVPLWMGLCHGWANAAFMVNRPARWVELPTADGRRSVIFYPDDIKALASLLWAQGEVPTRFVGGRCQDANPQTDEYGRVISASCFDTNPGTFHLALTNQLGISKRSLVMDATYDYEVWNHPIVSYSYSYFNPNSLAAVYSLEEARVPIHGFYNDRFQRYRSPKARSVVGVVLDVSYMIETPPSHAQMNSPGQDAYRTARYIYDLELDASGKIIGGEWYTQAHPDFLYVPEPGVRAKTAFEEFATGTWVPGAPLPESWRVAGREAGQEGVPLAKIVETLLKWAAQ